MTVSEFIDRWSASQADEQASVQHFHRARRKDIRDLPETLNALGLVEKTEEDVIAV